MSTKKFHKPIQSRVLNLFIVFITGLGIITFTYYLSISIANTYQKRLDNQLAYEKLGEEILTNLAALENEFNKLELLEDSRDLTRAQDRVNALIQETLEIIQLMQNGGALTKSIPANFDDKDEVEVKIIYQSEDDRGYIVEVLELLPRILDVEKTANKLILAVDKKINANVPNERLATLPEISLLHKQVNTYLLRSNESANRIYYESHLEIKRITSERNQILVGVRTASMLIAIAVIFLGSTFSYRIYQQISNLLEEQRLAGKLLKEAELRYRTVADFTYDWEYWRNPDGTLQYVSPACERITGYSVSHILEHPNILQEIVLPEDMHIWEKHGQEIESEYTAREIRFRVRRRDGEVIWLEHTCQPVNSPSGLFIGYRASNRDVTERVRTRRSLRKSEEQYRLLAENMSDFIWVTDINNLSLTYASPSVKPLLGFTPEEIRSLSLEERVSANSISLIWEVLEEELHKTKEAFDPNRTRIIEIEMNHKDGHIVPCETTARFLYDNDGNPSGILGAARDIRARVYAQEAQQKSEGLYRSLVETSPVGILMATPKGKIISVNLAALKMLGSPSKEETKKINLLTFPPLVNSDFVSDFEKCLQIQKTIRNETSYTSKWGATIYSRYTLTAIRDDREELIGVQILIEDITEQKNDKADLQRQVRNLAAINNINTTIITHTNLNRMINKILEEISKVLDVDAADLLVFDEFALSLSCVAQHGFNSPSGKKRTVLRVGEGYAGDAALKRKTVQLDNLNDESHAERVPQRWRDESFLSYFGVPLLVKGELKGILEVFNREEKERDLNWRALLETLAQQAAIAIDNHFLLDALRSSNIELELAYETTLEGWARALEMRDYETKGHTERVASLTLRLAETLGIHGEELTNIRRGALLHDIGKIAISDTILLKAGPCTPEEWDLIKEHPQHGYDMLKEIHHFKPSLDIVLYHHERWDGDGYPHGLAGESIPLSARIFAIVDVWDALLNDRPYHEAWKKEKVIKHIEEGKEKHFDPRVADAFLEIIREDI